ncbi:DUF3006 domain-containing protein [Syntrophomonas curvata]
MKVIIDRFEGEFAILEGDDEFKTIPRAMLPAQAREGDVLVSDKGEWLLDSEAAKRRREKAEKLAGELWRD